MQPARSRRLFRRAGEPHSSEPASGTPKPQTQAGPAQRVFGSKPPGAYSLRANYTRVGVWGIGYRVIGNRINVIPNCPTPDTLHPTPDTRHPSVSLLLHRPALGGLFV